MEVSRAWLYNALRRAGKRLKGDLDNIVSMAMRKEPERSYQSVEQLSEDIRRHSESLPVMARQDGVNYRLVKFIRRHRAGVASGLLAAFVLTACIVTTSLEAHRARVQERLAQQARMRAERRFNEVRKLARTVLFDYHDYQRSARRDAPTRTASARCTPVSG